MDIIAGLNTTAPCIAAFGVTRDNIADVKVIVQTDNLYLSIPCQPLFMFVLRVIIFLV